MIIDMHSHILAGVDDGPKTKLESIGLLEQSVEEGITNIIATSHAYHPQFHTSFEEINKQVNELNAECKKRGLPITIFTGQEIRVSDQTPANLLSGEALGLANSKYVLIELPSQGIPSFTTHIIQQLLNQNKIPIIAHPERNRAIVEKPSRLAKLVQHGALAQVTAGSLSGHFGKTIQRTAVQLVDAHLVHVYGSDVHNMSTRPSLFNKGLDYLDKMKKHEYVDILLENNARILTNAEMILLEPEEIGKEKWWKVF
ncbi:tyrosine-protein phosphatase [Paenisporosarcina sp. TG-14]|uniref:tyrosine-protein phosphatase n=1 Tax=Paenisporosarcina sp. TG-14 TaxID=1231057 RepID=UPI0002E7A345|nr:CpsB/CapC family capsule biosynthesis tyrosine phosphatase [Paenisporosarcina sp. TG-14]